jgi:hypothetical protein
MSRSAKRWLWLAGLVVAIGAIMGGLTLLPIELRFSPVTRIGAILAAVVVATFWVHQDWRQIDEFQREAHKRAGLWGLGYGMLAGWCAIGTAIVIFVSPKSLFADHAALAHGQWPHQPLMLMMLGGLVVILTALFGYLVTLAIWRLRNSGERHAV